LNPRPFVSEPKVLPLCQPSTLSLTHFFLCLSSTARTGNNSGAENIFQELPVTETHPPPANCNLLQSNIYYRQLPISSSSHRNQQLPRETVHPSGPGAKRPHTACASTSRLFLVMSMFGYNHHLLCAALPLLNANLAPSTADSFYIVLNAPCQSSLAWPI
jgi:hypothetical protein